MSKGTQGTVFPTRNYAAGKVVFFEGQTSDTAYLIKKGRIEISRRQGNNKVILNVLSAPEIFGEMAFINNEPRSATAETLEECELIVIQKEQLDDFLAQSPVVMRALVRCLSQRLRTTNAYVQAQGPENNLASVCYVLSLMEPSYPVDSTPNKKELIISYDNALKQLNKSLGFSNSHSKTALETIVQIGLFKFEVVDGAKMIVIPDRASFNEQARHIGLKYIDSNDSESNAYITINDLAAAIGSSPGLIREKLCSGDIPDSLIYFFKPDLFRWIDQSET